ncbi:MAG: NAD(P)/FAD-dependent oxidoreductase, partial [Paracoccaceae bacterium]
VQEFGRGLPLIQAVKALPIRLIGPRPMDEAISVAGGIARESLTEDLELRAIPGVYACGEMLDWEAPTGGYLITGCLATGRWAGGAAARQAVERPQG